MTDALTMFADTRRSETALDGGFCGLGLVQTLKGTGPQASADAIGHEALSERCLGARDLRFYVDRIRDIDFFQLEFGNTCDDLFAVFDRCRATAAYGPH